MNSEATVRAISGAGGKGPACFLIEAREGRIMLDLGYGPQPGLLPNVDGVGNIDALILSHGHRDHAGGLSLLPQIGNPPVYATEIVARGLPPGIDVRIMPLRGSAEMLGVRVETGRSGHAPGGIWIRFAIADGLLYMGDHSRESILYAYDEPAQAKTAIIDASYGGDDTPLAARLEQFHPLFTSPGVLLPVPTDGRGPEIALYLSRSGYTNLRVDEAMRSALRQLAEIGSPSLHEGVAAELAQIADRAGSIDGPRGIMLASRADATDGEAARLVAKWEHAPDPAIVFTGYVPPGTPAERLVKGGRASFLRWNVHPRISDNAALVHATGARIVIPAFCDRSQLSALARAFAPARVTIDTPLPL
ncbi:MAG TPA: MBL fold metallo-hydrolase [Candidatus Binatia bacterium]|nr:MBL fold metallo-hydrolase [Candidatus Binatia bacterium]